ncbi:DUF2267 domain-containing protein [Belliella marina]|uniref:DUF2267 domain-containing protein n=1 Tax=Belliella marina TaxID=1644146 RepID=A0ABW4VSW1_9BACT
MSINFDKFAQQGNFYIKQLAEDLGHPEDLSQTSILLRSVLHAVRDRISFQESLHFLSQLPMFLKALYVETWVYDTDSTQIKRLEEFKTAVKDVQMKFGERQFDWKESTEELISKVLQSLGKHFLTEGQLSHVAEQMPKEVKPLFPYH